MALGKGRRGQKLSLTRGLDQTPAIQIKESLLSAPDLNPLRSTNGAFMLGDVMKGQASSWMSHGSTRDSALMGG